MMCIPFMGNPPYIRSFNKREENKQITRIALGNRKKVGNGKISLPEFDRIIFLLNKEYLTKLIKSWK